MISRKIRPLRVAAAPRIQLATNRMIPIAFRSLTTESSSTPSSSEASTLTSQEITSKPITVTPIDPSQIVTSAVQTDVSSLPPHQLPYFVGRNQLNNLSVYQRKMRGGSLKKTLLKRGEGNLQALRNDIAEALDLSQKEVTINNVTRHIEIKGHRRDDIVRFLRNAGF